MQRAAGDACRMLPFPSQVVGDSERLLSSLHATSSAGGPEWAREPWARLLRWRGRAFSSGGGRGTKVRFTYVWMRPCYLRSSRAGPGRLPSLQEVPKREGRKGDAGAGETRPPPQETPVAPGAGKGSTSYTRPITWGSVAAVLGALPQPACFRPLPATASHAAGLIRPQERRTFSTASHFWRGRRRSCVRSPSRVPWGGLRSEGLSNWWTRR